MSSTQMSNPRELFLHELGDVLYAEQTLVKALPKLRAEASNMSLPRVSASISKRPAGVKNVKLAFEELGEPAKAEKCPGIEGINKEHDDFIDKSRPRPTSWIRS